MVTAAAYERVRDDVVRLAHRGLSVAEYSRSVGDLLSRAVPAEGSCLMTVDPATMLPTAEYVENGLPAPALLRLVEIEVREPDYNKWTELAHSGRPAATLSDVTAGDLDRSLRQREIRGPGGFADELRVVLAGSSGCWGQLTVFREAKRPYFSDTEARFVGSLAGFIADGLRRSLLIGDTRTGAEEVGMAVLDADDGLTMTNPTADRWLDELGISDRTGARLPLVVSTVVRQARALASLPMRPSGEPIDLRPAVARVCTRSGRWLIVRASLLGDRPDSPVAVLLEVARRAELAPLIADAYGFTDSERRVTELVAQGLSTREIAGRLHLSSYTVQDHLKSIFTKSGASSRGDLTARLFFDHYAGALTSRPAPAES